ncbi:uncharacterized protein [Nicotiana tomentosiformis]|uniref:uncharacterized protein n=1 Tax=Nicotiana tomentosiformis TaxID=4098 RepID=UPI00388C7A32
MVANALSRKAVSMGSLAFILIGERSFASYIHALDNQFMRLDVSKPSRVIACVVSRSFLFDCIRERQYADPHLLVLKDTVQHDSAKEVSIGDGGVLLMCRKHVPGLEASLLVEEDEERQSGVSSLVLKLLVSEVRASEARQFASEA